MVKIKEGLGIVEVLTCDGCFQQYDFDLHRPKVLNCGHSMCLQCIQNGRKCVWHIEHEILVPEVKDDSILLKLLAGEPERSRFVKLNGVPEEPSTDDCSTQTCEPDEEKPGKTDQSIQVPEEEKPEKIDQSILVPAVDESKNIDQSAQIGKDDSNIDTNLLVEEEAENVRGDVENALTEAPQRSFKHLTSVKELGRQLVRLLYEYYSDNGSRSNQFCLTLTDFSHPPLVALFGVHKYSVTFLLRKAIFAQTMRELQDARWFSLILNTQAIPSAVAGRTRERDVVSVCVRYCLPDGEPVERLLYLVDACASRGLVIFRLFSADCESHGIDWTQTLCCISVDCVGTSQQDYMEVVTEIRKQSKGAPLAWHGAYRLWELIEEGCCVYPYGKYFFEILTSLRRVLFVSDFFGTVSERFGAVLGGLSPDSTQGIILLLCRAYSQIKSLLRGLEINPETAKTGLDSAAITLTLAISQVEFLSTLFLFVEVLNATRHLELLSDLTSVSSLGDMIHFAVDDLTLKCGVQNLSSYLNRAEKYARVFSPKPFAYERTSIMSSLAQLAQVPIGIISSRLLNIIGVLRDIETVCAMATLTEEDPIRQSFLRLLTDSPRIYGQELLVALAQCPHSFIGLPAWAALKGLLKTWERAQFSAQFPHIYNGLQLMCALPLLPPSGDVWKLDVIRESLRSEAVKFSSTAFLEARLTIQCAADGPVMSDSLEEDIADEVFERLVEIKEDIRNMVLQI